MGGRVVDLTTIVNATKVMKQNDQSFKYFLMRQTTNDVMITLIKLMANFNFMHKSLIIS